MLTKKRRAFFKNCSVFFEGGNVVFFGG